MPRPGLRLAGLLATLLVLTACAERPAGSGPVTLVFKHARILGPADPIPALLAEFEAARPGVRVRSEALPWTADDQHQLYVINLEGRSPGFDVMMLDVIWVPEFARAGWLLDLTPHVSPEDLAHFFPSTVTAATWGGRVWALPWNVNVGLLYYRADLLARYGLAPPVTWDELVNGVRRIQAGEGDPAWTGTSGRASSTRGWWSTCWRRCGQPAPNCSGTTATFSPTPGVPPTPSGSCGASSPAA